MSTFLRFKCVVMTYALVLSFGFTLSTTPASAQTVLQYWSPWGEIWQEMQEQIVAEFNAEHPHIQVEYVFVPSNVLYERLLLSPEPPDVVALWGFSALELAPNGVLAPLDAWIARDLNADEFYPAALRQYSWNGRIWAASYGISANALIYNRQLLEESGIREAPRTMEEMQEYARSLVRRDADNVITQLAYLPLDKWGGFLNFSYMFGAEYIDEQTGRITATGTPVFDALHWMVDYYNQHGGAQAIGQFQSQAGGDPFLNNRLAMKLSHSWYTASIHQQAPTLDWDVAPIPLPQGEGQNRGPLLGTDGLAIHANAPHPEEAWEFLRWMMTRGQQRWAEIQGIHSGWFVGRPIWAEYVPDHVFDIYSHSASIARPVPSLPTVNYLMGRLATHAQAVLTGDSWPEKALEDTEREVQVRLDEILAEARN